MGCWMVPLGSRCNQSVTCKWAHSRAIGVWLGFILSSFWVGECPTPCHLLTFLSSSRALLGAPGPTRPTRFPQFSWDGVERGLCSSPYPGLRGMEVSHSRHIGQFCPFEGPSKTNAAHRVFLTI